MHHPEKIQVEQDIIKMETEAGLENKKLLDQAGVKTINIMGAIGSGKTSLIEIAIEHLKEEHKIAVIAGDVIADFDSERFSKHGILVIPMNTGKECHLDAHMVKGALEQCRFNDIDLLFIENVGNLICPADFFLGEHKRVIVVSVTEGQDTVAKQPAIFKTADVVIVNKVDIAQFVDVDPDNMVSDALINTPLAFKTSVRTGLGIEQWIDFIRKS